MRHLATRALAVFCLVSGAACFSQGPPVSLRRVTDDDAGTNPRITIDMPAADASLELLSTDPHALVAVDPSHGPFSGGQTRLLRGNGFGTGLRVWFGPNEIAVGDILPIDPSRAQVVVPPGNAGAADVKTQIGSDASTTRVLQAGYVYEDFYADPSDGPTSGGTVVHLFGQATAWGAGTTVTVDNQPCQPVNVVSPSELTCATPQGTPGAKSITVTTADKVSVVREAFTYSDSDNGFRGGLSGSTLTSHLTVLAFDNLSGNPIQGAFVLAGASVASGMTATTDRTGVASFDTSGLGPTRSVTVAAPCYQPTTFVDVPVDTVTAYLTPVLSPACASGGDPPSVGGRGVAVSTLRGELVWGVDGEFRNAAWSNVPAAAPNSTERRVAYVFRLSSDPTDKFSLPSASDAVSSDVGGTVGFPFHYDTTLGNLTLYALAGIEDRAASPPKFTAYAMGLVRGVSASPGVTTSNIFIPISIPLDHAVTLQAKTPSAGPRGPDRASFSVAIEIEKGGYAILPTSSQSWLMPVDRTLSLVGFPSLSGNLADARYIASASAGTGPDIAAPLSVVGQVASKSETIGLDNFVPVPVLSYPPYGGAWDGQRVSVTFAPSAKPIDVTVLQLQGGGGLVTWQVVAPGGTRAFQLPDLQAAFPKGALPTGNVSINVYGAQIADFDYRTVTYRQMSPPGFDAYSLDVFPALFE